MNSPTRRPAPGALSARPPLDGPFGPALQTNRSTTTNGAGKVLLYKKKWSSGRKALTFGENGLYMKMKLRLEKSEERNPGFSVGHSDRNLREFQLKEQER
ncbi:MAG: hypothetical protein ABFD80_03205 [Acidobacteriota bacterium]